MLRKTLLGAALMGAAVFSIGALPAQSQVTGPPGTNAAGHPAYLHALHNLRDAHHEINTTGIESLPHDQAALKHIEDAINDIKQAGVDDGKPMEDTVKIAPDDHKGRLGKALVHLQRALKDATREETNKSNLLGHNSPLHLQHRASDDIKLAIKEVKLAVGSVI